MEGDGVSGGHFEGTLLCGLEGPLAVPLSSHPQAPPPPAVPPSTAAPHASQSGYPRRATGLDITTPYPLLHILPMLESGNSGVGWAPSQCKPVVVRHCY